MFKEINNNNKYMVNNPEFFRDRVVDMINAISDMSEYSIISNNLLMFEILTRIVVEEFVKKYKISTLSTIILAGDELNDTLTISVYRLDGKIITSFF